MCDGSHDGFGAVLKQLGTKDWRSMSFASTNLSAAEEKYFIIELEMLVVVWAAENVCNFNLGRKFQVVNDHKALVSLLNDNNKKNQAKFNRLTKWLDRLTQFDFEVKHIPGAKIGPATYLSRYLNNETKAVSAYISMFTVAKITLI